MPNFFADNAASIGRTPLVRLNRLAQGTSATLLAKVEGRGPAYSVKDRIGVAIFLSPENRSRVLEHFQRITVQNVAFDLSAYSRDNKIHVLPFFAQVDWQDSVAQETVFVQGAFHEADPPIDFSTQSGPVAARSEQINRALASLFEINALSTPNFTSTLNTEETARLMRDVVGPFVFGDAVVIPLIRSLAQAIGDAVGSLIKGIFGLDAKPQIQPPTTK